MQIGINKRPNNIIPLEIVKDKIYINLLENTVCMVFSFFILFITCFEGKKRKDDKGWVKIY